MFCIKLKRNTSINFELQLKYQYMSNLTNLLFKKT